MPTKNITQLPNPTASITGRVNWSGYMTDTQKMAEANRWLDKAISYEADGKPDKFVDMALEKACKLEREALGIS